MCYHSADGHSYLCVGCVVDLLISAHCVSPNGNRSHMQPFFNNAVALEVYIGICQVHEHDYKGLLLSLNYIGSVHLHFPRP